MHIYVYELTGVHVWDDVSVHMCTCVGIGMHPMHVCTWVSSSLHVSI